MLRYTSLASLLRGESVGGIDLVRGKVGGTGRSLGRESYSHYELYDRRINKIKK